MDQGKNVNKLTILDVYGMYNSWCIDFKFQTNNNIGLLNVTKVDFENWQIGYGFGEDHLHRETSTTTEVRLFE